MMILSVAMFDKRHRFIVVAQGSGIGQGAVHFLLAPKNA
jgi:hypothetical protein